ncbi:MULTISPECIES: DUF5719 family protein [Streptomycetaceae]|uniref:Secreted protein n=1 Tax=Streptantibioticus cattleyicolor (strain ATCC 35852 / DSM 46488 / JCM 4925 / NBRC 14057 / NRRL 8057) TaxID=1003195 RepID=F8JVB2_STREN|nr:DUF5719 family protein [Streptantibioticus cattleyicolor]AEW94393.1 hypothetical protein SCATT_20220 [Streptantibioticus cattleyicolor NRRL 8057 = DSM 46488]MYS59041.1 hypothetical protein [Streptomyces sp. SID5468]CCB74749.1 putative secreted protein [Streptantibioticus cattleyicolor NRRL 8057 = DSM 46488]
MNRTIVSFAGVVVALAAVTGAATALAPAPDTATRPATQGTVARKPVERSTLLCPGVEGTDYASTTWTSYTPPGTGGTDDGTASLRPAQRSDGAGGTATGGGGKPVAPLTRPGTPVTADGGRTTPALTGTADGRLAPGWAAQATTTVDAGAGRGLLGTSCTAPGADFWFPGASTAAGRQDYVHLINPDPTAAVVDIELYDANGAVKTTGGDGITVPGGATVPVLLSTLAAGHAGDLTVHVAVRSGRVGADLQAMDAKAGGDWLPATAPPAADAVIPGIPADATSVRLIAYATGDNDADLKVQLLTPQGPITPAGHETLHVKSGMTTAVDLPSLTQGEPGSLRLTPTDRGGAPFVAAVRVTRGKGLNQETAFIPATAPVGARATAADNRAKGSTIALTAPTAAATVRISSSAGSGGGSPATTTVTVRPGTTVAVAPPAPAGLKGTFAVTVETLSGGPVHASRMLALPQDAVPAFTIQPLPDDGGTVAVPVARQDLTVLQR